MLSNLLFANHEHNIKGNWNSYTKTKHNILQYLKVLFLAHCQTSCSIIETFNFDCTVEVSYCKRPVSSKEANVSDCATEGLTKHKQIPWKVLICPLPLLIKVMILFELTYNWSFNIRRR